MGAGTEHGHGASLGVAVVADGVEERLLRHVLVPPFIGWNRIVSMPPHPRGRALRLSGSDEMDELVGCYEAEAIRGGARGLAVSSTGDSILARPPPAGDPPPPPRAPPPAP